MKSKLSATLFAGLLSVGVTACDDEGEAHEDEHGDEDEDAHDHDHGHDHDEGHGITTVTLTFTSEDGEVVTGSFRDEDGPGGESGVADKIILAADTTYNVEMELVAELEETNVTELIADRAEGHFVFFHGPQVSGPASAGDGFLVHEFDDLESDYTENEVGEDLPLGLASIVTTTTAGEADLSVIVRHLPELNDTPQKTADLPEAFARGEEIAGSNDVDVTFDIEVE